MNVLDVILLLLVFVVAVVMGRSSGKRKKAEAATRDEASAGPINAAAAAGLPEGQPGANASKPITNAPSSKRFTMPAATKSRPPPLPEKTLKATKDLFFAAMTGLVNVAETAVLEGAIADYGWDLEEWENDALTTRAREKVGAATGSGPRCLNYGETPLHMAAAGGHLPVVKFLVECCPAVTKMVFGGGVGSAVTQHDQHVLRRNGISASPLKLAVIHGHVAVVAYLLDKGAAKSMCTGMDGDNDSEEALLKAALRCPVSAEDDFKNNIVECIKLLLERGVGPTELAEQKKLYHFALQECKFPEAATLFMPTLKIVSKTFEVEKDLPSCYHPLDLNVTSAVSHNSKCCRECHRSFSKLSLWKHECSGCKRQLCNACAPKDVDCKGHVTGGGFDWERQGRQRDRRQSLREKLHHAIRND